MADSILVTKLYIPPPRPELVSRSRLIERLNAGLRPECRLTLISASAGFGKTTLLSEWIHQKDEGRGRIRFAWVSLDAGDNDPIRFMTYCVAALQTVQPGLGESVLPLIQSRQPLPIKELLTVLVNEMAESPVVLVLDDYHVIESEPIHTALTFLLDHLPPQMHLVIASRADPPLSIARLRARGQLAELRTGDLLFTPDEAAAFLNGVMGLGLADVDVMALEERTEGWIAGLQMAALSLRGRIDVLGFIQAFTGSHRFVLDYLVEEVLNRQSPDVQQFLLETCVLDQLTGSLCNMLTGRSDGQAMLERLEQANLFVVPLDTERRWYRYHHLFADLLRGRLNQIDPNHLTELHCRARMWLEENGFIAEAIGHAFATGDIGQAARIAEENALAMMDHGQIATLVSWLNALPGELVRSRPWLCIAQAWIYVYAGQLGLVEPLLQDAEKGLIGFDVLCERQRVAGHIAAVHAYAAWIHGQGSLAAELTRKALAMLPQEDRVARCLAATTLGNALQFCGDLAGAAQAFQQAVAIGREAGHTHSFLLALSGQAYLFILRGQLCQAFAACQEALRLADNRRGAWQMPALAALYATLSIVLCQRNDLDGALHYAQQGVELAEKWQQADTLHLAYTSLAEALAAQGNMDGALEIIRKAKQVADQVSPWFVRISTVQEAMLRLAMGDAESALRWLQPSGLDADADIRFEHLTQYYLLARTLMAQGKTDEAFRLLTRTLEVLEKREAGYHIPQVLVSQALALKAMGQDEAALAALERALTLAQPEGYVRAFVDEGEPIARLLRQAASRGIAAGYVTKLLSAFEPSAKSQAASPTVLQGSHQSMTLVEPLSERELEVLRLLAAGLSNKQVAQTLMVAVDTVKKHLKNIYGKLDVHSRTQAVARAQGLGLL